MHKNKMLKPRGAGRLSAEEAAKLGDRLLDAAHSLFDQKGFAETTMEQVARVAGSSTQTIYSRYANKGALLEAVIRRAIERTVAEQEEAVAVDPSSVAPRDYLIGLGTRVLETLKKNAGLARLTHAEGYRSPELQRLGTLGFERGSALIGAALVKWRDQGLFDAAADLNRAARLGLSMMTDRARISAVLGAPLSERDGRRHVADAVDLFLRGLGFREAPAKGSVRPKRRQG